VKVAGVLEVIGVMVLLLVVMARAGRRAPEIELRRDRDLPVQRG
jgi:hypothetical protein